MKLHGGGGHLLVDLHTRSAKNGHRVPGYDFFIFFTWYMYLGRSTLYLTKFSIQVDLPGQI
eukprot:SAG11_NODE_7_length_31267_cov_19.541966_7_plen_61_part_00